MAKLSERYAKALLELSEEKGTVEKDLKNAQSIVDKLKRQDVQLFLKHPHIPDAAKKRFFQEVCAGDFSSNTSGDFSRNLPGDFSGHMMGFLYLMVKKNRETLIIPALTEYIDLAKRILGLMEAKVVSAKPLTEMQLQAISALLSKKFNMQVDLEHKVDPDVIGGFYILADGKVFDCTVRAELNRIKERLKRGVMNDS